MISQASWPKSWWRSLETPAVSPWMREDLDVFWCVGRVDVTLKGFRVHLAARSIWHVAFRWCRRGIHTRKEGLLVQSSPYSLAPDLSFEDFKGMGQVLSKQRRAPPWLRVEVAACCWPLPLRWSCQGAKANGVRHARQDFRGTYEPPSTAGRPGACPPVARCRLIEPEFGGCRPEASGKPGTSARLAR